MPITPLPTPVPSRADPANFAARADAFMAALPAFATQANALEVNVDAAEAVCQSAAQTVNVTAWNSGTSYTVGVNVYDATTLLTYRRKTVGSGGLRPGLNGTDWQLLTGFGNVDLASAQTLTNKTLGTGSVWDGQAIPVDHGGTGQITAAEAFNALKQAATETATGVVELATTTEAAAGTDTTRAVTPAGAAAAIAALAPAPTTATVTAATAGATAGAVGTYAFLETAVPAFTNVTYNAGAILSGSLLRYTSYIKLGVESGFFALGTPAGSWRLMGYMNLYYEQSQGQGQGTSVWLRIS